MENPSYYAVLPADIRYAKDLNPLQKILYAEITALSNKFNMCWASNKYFSSLYGVGETYISKTLTMMASKGYISIEIDKSTGNSRYIRVTPFSTNQSIGTEPCETKEKPLKNDDFGKTPPLALSSESKVKPHTPIALSGGAIAQKCKTSCTIVQDPSCTKVQDNNIKDNIKFNKKEIKKNLEDSEQVLHPQTPNKPIGQKFRYPDPKEPGFSYAESQVTVYGKTYTKAVLVHDGIPRPEVLRKKGFIFTKDQRWVIPPKKGINKSDGWVSFEDWLSTVTLNKYLIDGFHPVFAPENRTDELSMVWTSIQFNLES